MTTAKIVGGVVLGGLLLGLILDEVGNKGRLGSLAKGIAQKSTRGFGVGGS